MRLATCLFNLSLTGSLLVGLLLMSPPATGQTADTLPPTVPIYDPPAQPFPVPPDEASAAAFLTGLVVDERGQPYTGATLVIKGSRLGVMTGADGRYRLPVPSSYLSRRGRVKIVAGQIGFLRQTLRLDARLAEQPVIRLMPDPRPLH